MTPGEKALLTGSAAAVIALAAWAAVSGSGEELSVSVDAGPAGNNSKGRGDPGLDPDSAYDRAHWHLCMPSDMPHRITGRHALYRRPVRPGPNFTALTEGGWDWFANPPSELGGG